MSFASERRVSVLSRHLVSEPIVPELCTPKLSACRSEAPSTLNSKLTTADKAVLCVRDEDVVTIAGFVGSGCPDQLLCELRQRFDSTAAPRNLTLLYVASAADGNGGGLDRLSAPGLVGKLVYAWTGSAPGFVRLVRANKVQAWNLPLGVVSHMIRDVAARRPGPVTHVGLGTFVDPRLKGGRLNEITKEEIVEVVQLGGQELLWYKAPRKIHVALLRGSSADIDGNVAFEREPHLLDSLNQAMAAHNSGGTVVVQVERLVAKGSLPPRSVVLPAAIVDKVVVAPPYLHPQTFGAGLQHDASLTGEHRVPSSMAPLSPGVRRIIAHRALLELGQAGCIVNLGVGMPEGVATMLATHGQHVMHADSVQLTVEAGTMGGIPQSGLRFGTARNATSYMPTASMLDFYNGGGIDVAVLGMAQVDSQGNVNVSCFGDRMPGCGGFIDISQSAKKVLFVGTFTTGGLQVSVRGGRMVIKREGRERKFTASLQEVTFAASSARGREVLYITERAVFRLVARAGGRGTGLQLVEVAPGVDVARQVLGQMEWAPVASPSPMSMDSRMFAD